MKLRAASRRERAPEDQNNDEANDDDSDLEAEEKAANVPNESRTTVSGQELRLPPNMSLPIKVKLRILQHLLTFPGEPLHAISRLDPYRAPRRDPNDTNWEPRLLHRFHVGTAAVSLTDAINPNDLLAPLLVSSQWHFWGSTIFYSKNRFVFSSLGE